MTLYTRTGDKGTTSLYNGDKVRKNNDRIILLAELDHFISLYGAEFSEDTEILTALMDICTIIANPSKNYLFDPEDVLVKFIEHDTDKIMANLPKLTKFILSDNYIHVIRTACRKLETKLVELNNDNINKFINRLSSLLFARAYAKSKGIFYVSTYLREDKESRKKLHVTFKDDDKMKPRIIIPLFLIFISSMYLFSYIFYKIMK